MDDNVVTPIWISKLVGGVLLWLAIGSFAFVVWVAYSLALREPPGWLALVSVAAIVFTVGLFCLSVGWRLFLNRPNRYSSILSPTGWRVLGVAFASMLPLLLIGIVAMHNRGESTATLLYGVLSLAFGLVLAVRCFGQARVLANRIGSGRAAP